MLIRDCRPADFPAVFELLGQLWPHLELEAAVLEAVFASYIDDEADSPVCAAIDGQVVGFASVNVRNSLWRSGRVAFLDALVVHESRRRAGIGAALVGRVAEIARDRGCSCIELDSAFHRTGAHLFYERLGFEKTGFMFGLALDPR